MLTPSRAHRVSVIGALISCSLLPLAAQAPIRARVPGDITPAWNKGIQPISRESYWNAMACGKQGGANPPCVFYDTDLCKNDDFVLALYTPYKMVAHAVWSAVSKKQPPPTPSYSEAQRTRIVLGVTPARGSKNPLKALVVKRGGQAVRPVSQLVDGGRANVIFDFPAFAPTATVTIEMVGRDRTQACVLDRTTLARLR